MAAAGLPLSVSGAIEAPPESAYALAAATVRALLVPRRLLPVLVVATPLLYAQSRIGSTALVGVGVALTLACAVLAPVTWRLLCQRPTFARVLAYAAAGAFVVLAIAAGVPRTFHLRSSLLTESYSILVSIALYWVGGFGLGRDIDLERSLALQKARAEALAREAERAQLIALRAHLDPHFLFNTLNAIAEWCRLDGAMAETAVLRLADMLRAVLAGARADRWPLDTELDLVRALFELHRLRDPDRFGVRIDVGPGLGGEPMPPLVLLPLAENAVKHGPAAGHRGEIRLVVAACGDRLHIALSNPGPYGGPRAGSEGLPTVERRLALAYEGSARFVIGAEQPGQERTRVELDLPRADT